MKDNRLHISNRRYSIEWIQSWSITTSSLNLNRQPSRSMHQFPPDHWRATLSVDFLYLKATWNPWKKLNLSLLFGAQLRSLGIFFLYKTKIKKSIWWFFFSRNLIDYWRHAEIVKINYTYLKVHSYICKWGRGDIGTSNYLKT